MPPGYFEWNCEDASESLKRGIPFFHENGYVIFSSFATNLETEQLKTAAKSILYDFVSSQNPTASAIFTTSSQTQAVDSSQFLSSASKVSCFLEEKQPSSPTHPAVNKIGHAIHDLNPVVEAFCRQKKVRDVAYALDMSNPLLVQSMYILKNPRVGGEVHSHRDCNFVYGRSNNCLGFWWALENATLQNGCLWAVPFSHRDDCNMRRMIRHDHDLRIAGEEGKQYHDSDFVALPMQKGDLIMLHGRVMHKSLPNLSENSRLAFSIHVVDNEIDNECWLQRPSEFPFRPL